MNEMNAILQGIDWGNPEGRVDCAPERTITRCRECCKDLSDEHYSVKPRAHCMG